MGRLSKRALGLFIFPSGAESHENLIFTAYRAGEHKFTCHFTIFQVVARWADKTYDIYHVGGSKEYFRPVPHAVVFSY